MSVGVVDITNITYTQNIHDTLAYQKNLGLFLNALSTTGTWESWSEYSTCSRSCGGGSRQRTRTCGSSKISGCCAKCAGEKTQTQTENCNTQNCPIHGGWTSYSEWSTCNVSCGGGTQSKIRSCTNPAPQYGGENCVGSTTESRVCNTYNCPIHGGWTSYSEWSTCNVSCGGGTQSKIRSCTNPAPQYGGNNCVGSTTESRACNTYNCPIHGGWTSYSEWSTCNVSCGGGTQSKIRSCTNPAPQYGGNNCVGPTTESRACNTHNCPIHGGWSSYSEWSMCNVSCGGGTQSKIRSCTNPAPQYGGDNCEGQTTERKACNTHNCPVDGGWSEWNIGEWDSCPNTCGDEIQNREDVRYCNNPSPQYGGKDCEGADTRKNAQTCLEQKCPVNGGWADWNDWSVWGDCSTTCDEGIKYRNRERTCTNPEPLNGGNDCPGSNREVESTSCLLFQCPISSKMPSCTAERREDTAKTLGFGILKKKITNKKFHINTF
ncbi:hypothetical protein KUTeg_021229 [Tegillarca granosa]|uniref:Uncharacterized protein n=1 Tax=Tegillarca granosa TaxID=220873 RepID=A0ABQ9EA94_TEGGR|nr:hypothetical protein KUTeg_021229 [Tegillarca granosa]